MKFPFVSRAIYDDVVGNLRQQLAEEKQDRTALLAELARVTDKLLPAPKHATARAVTFPSAEDAARAEIEQRLDVALDSNKYTASNPRMRARIRRWADTQLAKQVPIEKVEDRIVNWSRVSNDDEDDDEGMIALVVDK